MPDKNYDGRIQTVCLVILTTVVITATLYLVKPVIVPFVLAVFLSLILIPVVEYLIRKLRVRRGIALVLTMALGFLVMFGLGSIIVGSMEQFSENSSTYEAQLTKLVENPGEYMMNMISGDESPKIESEAKESTGDTLVSEPVAEKTTFKLSALLPAEELKGLAKKLSASVMSIVSQSMLVMLFTAFLVTGSTTRRKARGGVLGEIESRVQKYIAIKIILSLLTGGLVFLVLKILGVEFALSFGVFAFMLNFIPNVGSGIATLLPLPVVLLAEDPSIVIVVLALLLPLMVQLVIGSVIEPKIMGDTLGLHPVVILMSLIFWGMLWGFPGMLLAAPMSSIAKIVFERIEVLKPVAALMGGRLEAINEMAQDEPTP